MLLADRVAHRSAIALAVIVTGTALAGPERLHGQSGGSARNQITVEVAPVYATVGYAWARGADRFVGIDLGLGVNEFDRTLVPEREEMTALVELFHVGAFVRSEAIRSVTLDGRVQLGIAELDGCSGCFPGLMGAVSGGAFWGGRRFRAGPRLTAGVIYEQGRPGKFAVNLRPISVVWTHGRR